MCLFLVVSLFLIGAHGENSLGVNTHILHNDVYDAVAAAGIPWVRIDVNWFDIEPQQGKFNWGEIDRVVNKALSLNMKIFATFAYTPGWASSGNKDGKANSNDVPEPGLYEKALSEAVKRYRGKIYHWGLWNEVNLEGFWEGTADQYVDLIVFPGYDAIKTNCPECFSLGPELANVGDKLNDFYNTIFSRAKDKFDIITHHIYQTFPELDPWAGYTSDSFFNALEKKRTFSTRMALYEALTKYNITSKDVWITETGYRCEPAIDQSEMNNQRLYYELVLKAQIERSWWTNTFFYEIYDCGTDIPDCSIDGYGILRRTSQPDSTYQDNFLFKPAYYYLRDFLNQHPEFKNQSQIDAGYEDVAVKDIFENDVSTTDDGGGIIKRVKAIKIDKSPVIDGDLSDFYLIEPVILNTGNYVKLTSDSSGDSDISARFFFMWDSKNLYIAAIIKDDKNFNTEQPADIWKGDSVQMAFDSDLDRTEWSYDEDGDYEFGFAVVNNSISTYRWVAPITSKAFNMFSAFKKNGNEITYELSIPFENLLPFSAQIGKTAGISFLVNDNDGNGREGFVQFTEGIGLGKNPAAFGEITLAGGLCEIEKECKNISDCAGLIPQCNCIGEWICNGRGMCEWVCSIMDAGIDIVEQEDTSVQDIILYDVSGREDVQSIDNFVPDSMEEDYKYYVCDCTESIDSVCPEGAIGKKDMLCKNNTGNIGYCCFYTGIEDDYYPEVIRDGGKGVSSVIESSSGCGCSLLQ